MQNNHKDLARRDNLKFKITDEHTNWRLDKFVKEKYPDHSRAHLQRMIKNGKVLINGKNVSAHHFLKNGDQVEILISADPETKVEQNGAVAFDILVEEDDFLIINKPAELVVHQSDSHREPDTLVNGLLVRYPEIARVGDDLLRPGIVHRLDGDASGVMVVARTQDMFDHLKKQFKIHQTKKEYLALVYGQISPPSGLIEFDLEKQGAKMIAKPKGEGNKSAATEYNTVSPLQNGVTLLQIAIHTGRTHQIRVHLFAMGNPIVGDKLYGPKTREIKTAENFQRLMLHARKLGFFDLKNKWREYEAPLPPEFNF